MHTMISTNVDLYVLAVYESSFTSKEGREVKFYKAVIKVEKGVKELSITANLYEEMKDYDPGVTSVKFVYDVERDKARLDTI